jgi:hypothetical protein
VRVFSPSSTTVFPPRSRSFVHIAVPALVDGRLRCVAAKGAEEERMRLGARKPRLSSVHTAAKIKRGLYFQFSRQCLAAGGTFAWIKKVAICSGHPAVVSDRASLKVSHIWRVSTSGMSQRGTHTVPSGADLYGKFCYNISGYSWVSDFVQWSRSDSPKTRAGRSLLAVIICGGKVGAVVVFSLPQHMPSTSTCRRTRYHREA